MIALSTWAMPVYPLATPPSRVVRMEEADERLLAMKGAIHDFVSSSCTSGKKGTGAERGCEPRPAPRNQSSSRQGSGLGGLLTSSPILTAARASMAVSSGSGAAVATTPEGGSPTAILQPHRILQIHGSMTVLLLFSSPHSFSVGFRSEDRDSNGKKFILCLVTHFCVYVDVCFGLLSCWKIKTWPIIRFLTEAVRFLFFYLLVFDRIHDAMHLNKMSRTSSRKTGPQH